MAEAAERGGWRLLVGGGRLTGRGVGCELGASPHRAAAPAVASPPTAAGLAAPAVGQLGQGCQDGPALALKPAAAAPAAAAAASAAVAAAAETAAAARKAAEIGDLYDAVERGTGLLSGGVCWVPA